MLYHVYDKSEGWSRGLDMTHKKYEYELDGHLYRSLCWNLATSCNHPPWLGVQPRLKGWTLAGGGHKNVYSLPAASLPTKSRNSNWCSLSWLLGTYLFKLQPECHSKKIGLGFRVYGVKRTYSKKRTKCHCMIRQIGTRENFASRNVLKASSPGRVHLSV